MQLQVRCIRCHRRRCNCANRTQHTSSSFGARTDWRGCGTTQARRRCNHFRRCRCSQRRRLGLRLTQLTSESVLAIPDRPASKLEPLRCIWLHRLLESRCHCAAFAATDAHATAPIAHSTRAAPSVPGPIGAAAARRLGLCLTQLTSESVLAIPDRPASKLEPLRCIRLHRLLESRCHSTAHSTRQLLW